MYADTEKKCETVLKQLRQLILSYPGASLYLEDANCKKNVSLCGCYCIGSVPFFSTGAFIESSDR
jgi:hypothetical protein